MTTALAPLEAAILDAARRRTVDASFEARLHGVDTGDVQKAIRKLLRRKLIWQSNKPQKSYFGSGYAGYRAI